MSGDADRDAIRARRAVLIAAALAGCGGSAEPPPAPVATPASRDAGTETPPAVATAEPAPRRPIAIVAPADASDAEKAELAQWSYRLGELEHAIDGARALAPHACPITTPECEDTWARYAASLADLEHETRTLLPKCGFGRSRPKWLADGVVAAAYELQGRIAGVIARITEDLRTDQRLGALAVARWRVESDRARLARPVPCLSCIEETTPRILATVLFAEARTAVAPAASPVLDELAKVIIGNPSFKVVVQGHADPREPDRERVARTRADQVKKELEKRGVPGARLESKGYGATRPIADSATTDGRARNRRVDFEVVE